MTSNMDMRMVFENAKAAIIKAFPDASAQYRDMTVGQAILNNCKLTQSDLRFELPLVVGDTRYQFNILKNDPNLFAGQNVSTEKRLIQQNSAVIYSLGVFVAAPSSVNDNTFVLDSYPSPTKYGANAVPLQALFNNGYLEMKVNNDNVIPNWDLWKHYCANQTQATAAPGAGSPVDQARGEFDGFYPVEPNVTLIGSKDNIVTITLSAGLTSVLANSRVVLVVRTIMAQNSTVVS